MSQDLSMRVGAHRLNCRAAAIIRCEGAFLVNRLDDRACWFLPGGRVKDGEATADALRRELGEELGVDVEPLRPVFFVESFFALQGERVHELCVYYEVALPALEAARVAGARAVDGGLELAWVAAGDLADLDLRPDVLKSGPADLPRTLEHVVLRPEEAR